MVVATVQTKEVMLSICEIKVFTQPIRIVCFGLGSCIGLFLYDPKTGTTGAAHVMMPGTANNAAVCVTCYVANALATLTHLMVQAGSDLVNVKAKIVGGANVVKELELATGKTITSEVCHYLTQQKITIVGSDVGGSISRTARFNSLTGEVESTSAYGTQYYVKL
jgi:chemotaxis protein CheD